MKTKALLLVCALLALTACSNDDNDVTQNPATPTTTEAPQPITFRLTAQHPDDSQAAQTRAVKQTWEAGDAIFVFFSGAAAPKHLKMTFDGSAWTSAEYNGATQTAGALGLKNGDTGTMRAVFLPFGSDATVSASGTDFTFSKTYYAYYATATLDYTVTGNEVSGAFDMTIPDGYVQFFIEDGGATDGGYTLGTDAVIPVGVASIAADGTITETSDKEAKDDLPGYAYDNGETNGYIFSGKLVEGYNYKHDNDYYYYFAKTKVESTPADNSRADLLVKRENALESHAAVKLPGHDSDRWIEVGPGKTVDIGYELGTWYTCNYGASVPEEVGTKLNWADAGAAGTLPERSKFENVSWSAERTWMGIHGKEGLVVKSNDGNGFIFLPKTDEVESTYWSSTEDDEDIAYCLVFHSDGDYGADALHGKYDECGVRFLQN